MLAIAAAGPQTMIRTTALVAALAIAGAAHAASPRDSLVVTPAWLAEHASDANLVILHAGAAAEYQAAHIAGARLVTQADISAAAADSNGLSLELPSAAVLHDQLEALGISNTSRIVVEYAQGQIQAATRIIFTLDAAGLGDKVSLLDGGLSAWTKEGRTVTAEATPSKTGALAALKMQPHIVDAAFIQAHAATPGYDLIDARATNFYDGSQAGAAQGAKTASMILLRLPGEVRDVFREWLLRYFPDRVRHVLNLVRDTRGGKDNDPNFHTRFKGEGAYAVLLQQRFQKARERYGLTGKLAPLRTDLFVPPVEEQRQLSLF